MSGSRTIGLWAVGLLLILLGFVGLTSSVLTITGGTPIANIIGISYPDERMLVCVLAAIAFACCAICGFLLLLLKKQAVSTFYIAVVLTAAYVIAAYLYMPVRELLLRVATETQLPSAADVFFPVILVGGGLALAAKIILSALHYFRDLLRAGVLD